VAFYCLTPFLAEALMNDLESALALFVATLAVTTLAATVAWIRARERAIRAEVTLAGLTSGTQAGAAGPRPEGHEERLEVAIDALAVELERLGEGQRFIAQALADRRPDRALPASRPDGGRVATPH
jgi:hypothetical protein